MIDYVALQSSVDALTEALRRSAGRQWARSEAACALWARAVAEPEVWRERLAIYAAQERAPWGLGVPREPLGVGVPHDQHRFGVPHKQLQFGVPPQALAPPYAVVATDGSQLTPSHHEIALCCVLNVGRVRLHYGPGARAVLEARPRLYHREDELFPRVEGRLVRMEEAAFGALRGLLEWQHLVELAEDAVATGQPVVAFVDGPLVAYGMEALPEPLKRQVSEGRATALARLRALSVPVAGYISQSRSQEVVNFLRLVACPFEAPNCAACPAEAPPCGQAHTPLNDRTLWEALLNPGERSPLFDAPPPAGLARDEAPFAFFYLHVGAEAARLEVPTWVAEQPDWLARVQALAHDQACKGGGYPVALQEAHHLAVVTGEERKQFFAWLGRRLQQAGLRPALSPKERRKRGGFT